MSDHVNLDDDMRSEYDLDSMEVVAVGKYADRIRKEGATIRVERNVVLDHEVNQAFPTDEAVNEALRGVMATWVAPAPPTVSGS